METNGPTTPKRLKTAERREEALRYRLGGFSFNKIGIRLGITRQSARMLVVHVGRP